MKLCCLHQNGHQISSRYGHVLLLEDRIVVIRIKNYKKLKLFIIYQGKAQMEYGFGDEGGQGNESGQSDQGGSSSSSSGPKISENLMQISVYYDSFNIKYIENKKIYEVKSDLLSPHHRLYNFPGSF